MAITYTTPPEPVLIVNEGPVSEVKAEHQNEALDEALMESFPASDPIAVNFTWVSRTKFPTKPA